MMVIAVIGALTALFAATIALVQNDIKKVLAYSTVSQLGFMFLGVGVGAFTAGFFHVFTHAFFKACLFLGAGSVIHAMHARIHDDDAVAGHAQHGRPAQVHAAHVLDVRCVDARPSSACPLTSGFFSKDEILYRAFVDHIGQPVHGATHAAIASASRPTWLGPLLYCVGIVAATMTAFYMCRALLPDLLRRVPRLDASAGPSLLAKHVEHAHDGTHEHDARATTHDARASRRGPRRSRATRRTSRPGR